MPGSISRTTAQDHYSEAHPGGAQEICRQVLKF